MRNELLIEALAMIRAAGFEPKVVQNRHHKVSWGRPARPHAVLGDFVLSECATSASRFARDLASLTKVGP